MLAKPSPRAMTGRLTPDDDVEDEDDEAQNATASAILPGGCRGGADGRSEGEGGQPKLEEEGESGRDHGDLVARKDQNW